MILNQKEAFRIQVALYASRVSGEKIEDNVDRAIIARLATELGFKEEKDKLIVPKGSKVVKDTD